jgi:predicted nucleic acid-binding protein
MIAVCDMGPLHYLVLIGCDHILPRVFDRVITARVVVEPEMADPQTLEPVRVWAANPPPWLEVLEPQQVEEIPSLGKRGVRGDGDRAVISLARELGADVLIMDDRKARREAKNRESDWSGCSMCSMKRPREGSSTTSPCDSSTWWTTLPSTSVRKPEPSSRT